MSRKELTTVVPEPGKDGAIQVEVTLPVRQRRRKASQNGEPGSVSKPVSRPQIPRITRLIALAIKFQDMVDCGDVRDYADLARLGYVTRARVTQIMNLLMLAPDIQEQLLFPVGATAMLRERELRPMVMLTMWREQRQYVMKITEAPDSPRTTKLYDR